MLLLWLLLLRRQLLPLHLPLLLLRLLFSFWLVPLLLLLAVLLCLQLLAKLRARPLHLLVPAPHLAWCAEIDLGFGSQHTCIG